MCAQANPAYCPKRRGPKCPVARVNALRVDHRVDVGTFLVRNNLDRRREVVDQAVDRKYRLPHQLATSTVSACVQTSVLARTANSSAPHFAIPCNALMTNPCRYGGGPESTTLPSVFELVLNHHAGRCFDNDLGEHSFRRRRPSGETSVLEESGKPASLVRRQDAPQRYGHPPLAASQE